MADNMNARTELGHLRCHENGLGFKPRAILVTIIVNKGEFTLHVKFSLELANLIRVLSELTHFIYSGRQN